MKNSLRKILNDELARKGYLSISEVYEITEQSGHKQSNAERRLRQSESPNARPVYQSESPHAIIGYEWVSTIPELKKEIYQDPARLFELPRITSV